jgi:hypothetical protein
VRNVRKATTSIISHNFGPRFNAAGFNGLRLRTQLAFLTSGAIIRASELDTPLAGEPPEVGHPVELQLQRHHGAIDHVGPLGVLVAAIGIMPAHHL